MSVMLASCMLQDLHKNECCYFCAVSKAATAHYSDPF